MPVPADAAATTELTLTLPAGLSGDEARLLLAIKLFEVGRVSLGRAARLGGFSLRGFIDVLGQHGVPVLNQSPESLRRDLDLE